MSNPDVCLISSILLETASTCCLHSAVSNHMFYIPAYIGYAVSFYLFPKALRKYSLNFAYTLWCSVGIIFTLVYEAFITNIIITSKKLLGVIFILIGIFLSS